MHKGGDKEVKKKANEEAEEKKGKSHPAETAQRRMLDLPLSRAEADQAEAGSDRSAGTATGSGAGVGGSSRETEGKREAERAGET